LRVKGVKLGGEKLDGKSRADGQGGGIVGAITHRIEEKRAERQRLVEAEKRVYDGKKWDWKQHTLRGFAPATGKPLDASKGEALYTVSDLKLLNPKLGTRETLRPGERIYVPRFDPSR